MRALKYLFIGNRINVLNEMISLGLDVKIIPPKDKDFIINELKVRDYDVLVSNGCPFIIPISHLPRRIFVNVHPSLLPDLKGKSPILEAIKLNKPMGVTCHHMVDEVDSGAIIAQVKVNPNRDDLNECYREMFEAEARVFRLAYQREFR